MRVLCACEQSQVVCTAFRNAGHEAYSCDLLPPSGGHPEWHLQRDALEVAREGEWDLIIAFPPCTHLSSAGARSWPQKRADGRQQAAVAFVLALWNCCDRIAIENPVGWLSTCWQRPTQYVEPWWFGHPYTKRTGLWLKNLPPLTPTRVVEAKWRWCSNQYKSGPRKDGTRVACRLPGQKEMPMSARQRSKTFRGLAEAMADQWGVDKSRIMSLANRETP